MSRTINDLNPQQKEAVQYTGGPLLVLAGAGSGKTRVITHRIAHLIEEKGVKPHQIMAVTFTNKAANEMKSRINSLLGDVHVPWMGTFHGMCAKILRIELSSMGMPSNFSILDMSDQLSLIRACFREINLDEKKVSPGSVLSGISTAKNRLLTPEELAAEAHGFRPELVANVYKMYQQKLHENRGMDFDDLIMQTVLLLRDNKGILEKYQERFQHVLIDEYQDVNYSQYVLARKLSGGLRNICAVGDDDQSIYGFRGADISIILRFEEDYPGARIIKLEENYRSTRMILEAAHAVVKKNRGRKEKKLWTRKTEGEMIGSNASLDGREEARYLVKEINRWLEKGMKFKDFVVLYRTNAQSRSIEEVLKQEGIDYDIVGGLRFYERAEIKDAICYLKFIINPWDYISFRRIINVPSRGIGNITQDKIIDYSTQTGQDLLAVMKQSPDLSRIGSKIQKTLSKFVTLIKKLKKKQSGNRHFDCQNLSKPSNLNMLIESGWNFACSLNRAILGRLIISPEEKLGVSKFIDAVLTDSGYIEMLKEDTDPRKNERLDNLDELISDAKEFELSSEDQSLEAFLEKVSLYADIDDKKDFEAGEDGKVTMMTVHSAKGLEFPIVFIVGLEEGLFPHGRCIEEGKESAMEEERRLFYVAMTRGIQKVYLTYARERTIQGRSHNQSPSRFLREVPEEFIDKYMPEFSKRSFTRRVSSVLDKPRGQEEKAAGVFFPGDSVYHKIFGTGIVKSFEKGYATVDFPGHGNKILSHTFLSHSGESASPAEAGKTLQPGDQVQLEGGPDAIVKKTDGQAAYVILSNGDVDKVDGNKLKLK